MRWARFYHGTAAGAFSIGILNIALNILHVGAYDRIIIRDAALLASTLPDRWSDTQRTYANITASYRS